ncbi:MAG: DUF1194 domain-containing protein, partial [Phycisphaerales bacterium]|nr:DUF1194 domain-containing protein [Phycisphaerales bacterium]
GAVFMMPKASQVNTAAASMQDRVPLELVLLVDTSGSVDATEYNLQRQGYIDAFRDADVQARIKEAGGIAVTYIEWSDATHQSIRVPWTKLETPEDCDKFSDKMVLITRTHTGHTMMAPAIEFAFAQITGNGFDSMKWIIDISGDGVGQNWNYYVNGIEKDGHNEPEFYGTPWTSVLASIPAGDSQINGICITTDDDVKSFYSDVLATANGGFMMQVDDFDEFGVAIREKILREVTSLPSVYD